MVTLSRLFIHPVKSMRGIGLTHAFADISGLAFDRLFMVTETDGTFITARQFPQMVKFIPAPLHDGLHLTAPDGSSAVVRLVISPRRPSRPKSGATILPPSSRPPPLTSGSAAFSSAMSSCAGWGRS